MRRLHGRVRPYPWGSRTVIARLQGRPAPSHGPEAELWLGAHASDPSTVDNGSGPVSLLDLIQSDPAGVLGERLVDEFGPRLPYLLKVLAAQEPLSLQAHPDSARARERYLAGDVNYVDPYHKPELLVAVSEFDALCGFRPAHESARVLAELSVPQLAPVLSILDGPGSDGERLRRAVTTLLEWPVAERSALVSTVAAAPATGGARSADGGQLAASLARRYPDDVGIVVALLLNHVLLQPGEAIWMPAGNLHAYLSGTGVEIMAASDNVLRGGLTGKRVDVPELLRVLHFEVLADPVLRPVPVAPGVETWPVPVPDFALYRATVGGAQPHAEVPAPGPTVALCLTGEVTVDDGTGPVRLNRGASAFGRPPGAVLSVTGAGEVYVAVPGGRVMA